MMNRNIFNEGFLLLLLLFVSSSESFQIPSRTVVRNQQALFALQKQYDDNITRRTAILSSLLIPSLTSASANADQQELPTITHKVFFDVRISRKDGTFYVRDDLPDIPENQVWQGRITFGLFGDYAPFVVDQFLKYLPDGPGDPNMLSDNPFPKYDRSLFTKYDSKDDLISGGSIPGLEIAEFGGSTALKYGERVLASPSLWIEKDLSSKYTKLKHNAPGLLTHRILDIMPSFDITALSTSPLSPNEQLDGTHFIFGTMLLGEKEDESLRKQNLEFLKVASDIPTYSVDRPPTASLSSTKQSGEVSDPKEEIASAVFNKQREIFRGAAKSFGDTRIDKVYEGKFLRKVQVTRAGLL